MNIDDNMIRNINSLSGKTTTVTIPIELNFKKGDKVIFEKIDESSVKFTKVELKVNKIMIFDKACEKIQNADDISTVKNVDKNGGIIIEKLENNKTQVNKGEFEIMKV